MDLATTLRRAAERHPGRGVDDLDRAADRQPETPPGPAPGADALSVLLYTSGTTGRPKGVPRTHAAERAAAVAHAVQTRQQQGERALGVMALFHTMGPRTLLCSIVVGGTWVGMPVFDAAEAGDLWVSGRVDDMINSGGENVYPDEIEAALARCPEIDDVCVVGLSDERWGQAVTAFVVPVPGADPTSRPPRRWRSPARPCRR